MKEPNDRELSNGWFALHYRTAMKIHPILIFHCMRIIMFLSAYGFVESLAVAPFLSRTARRRSCGHSSLSIHAHSPQKPMRKLPTRLGRISKETGGPDSYDYRQGERYDESSWGGPGGFDRSRPTRRDDNQAVNHTQRRYEQSTNTAASGTEDSSEGISSHFFSRKPINDPSFRHIDLDGSIFNDLCRGAGINRPSKIQSLSWPILLQGKHAIVADQTGSGKTLAYLIPLLQRALSTGAAKKSTPGAPRILVLAPTAELADQIHAVCMRLSQFARFATLVITATGSYNTSIRDQIRIIQKQPVDILISTPGRISTILRTRNSGLDLSRLQSIVLDEVDVLLIDDATFGPQLRAVGAAAPVEKTQFVFVTATLPDTIVAAVQKEFPDVQQVRGPGLHRLVPTVNGRLLDVSVPPQHNRDPKYCFEVKAQHLLESLRQTRCKRTLVFCNTVDSCRQVENLLNRRDRKGQIYTVLPYHNAMAATARNENLSHFARGADPAVDYILVCTDRASRGVDFDQSPVDHVIVFDFPQDPAEYVRRVGRTARAGRAGASTVFAYGWQLPIARSIMMGGPTSKLDSVTFSADADNTRIDGDVDHDDDGKIYSVDGPRGRLIRPPASLDNMIDGNIKIGKLWSDPKQ